MGKSSCLNCRTRSTNIDSLPQELLFHILLLLPDFLLHQKARLVCKEWQKIIDSQAFINSHIDHHSTYGLLLLSWSHNPLYLTATRGRIEISALSYDCRARILATCNGLAVESHLENEDLSLHVINLATKQRFLLPSFSTHNRVLDSDYCGITYFATSMEYKVTLTYSARGQYHTQHVLIFWLSESTNLGDISRFTTCSNMLGHVWLNTH